MSRIKMKWYKLWHTKDGLLLFRYKFLRNTYGWIKRIAKWVKG